MAIYARSILDRFREEMEREKDKTVLQLQTQIFRGFLRGDRPVFNLGVPRIGELVPLGFDYERERMDRPSTRPDNFLDAIRRIPDEALGIAPRPSRALSGGQIGQPADFTDEQRGGLGGLLSGGRDIAGDIGSFLGGAAKASLDAPLDSSFPGLAGLTAVARGAQITQAVTRGETDRLLEPLTLKTVAQTAIEPSLPEPAFEQIERIPIAGRPIADEARFLSSPAGTLTAAAFPGFTALGAAGGIAAGTAGEGLEALGAPGPIGEIAQVAGNILTPGAGVVKAPQRLRNLAGAVRGAPAEVVAKTPSQEAAAKLTAVIKDAKPQRGALEQAKSEVLKKRAGAVARELETGTGEEAFIRAQAQQKGKLPTQELDVVPREVLTGDDVTNLYEEIRTASGLLPFSRTNTARALTKILAGELPTRGEITMLERVFGKEMAQEILKMRPFGSKAWENALSAANIPRAIQTAFDFSAPFRQGVLLIGHPKEFFGNMRPMVKAFFSEGFANQVDDALRSGPQAARREAAGLYQPSFGGAAQLAEREEAFMTAFAGKIPGVRRSERAFVTYLNKLRSDVFDNIVAGWDRVGGLTAQDEQALAKMLNIFTGRGDLGQAGNQLAPVINQAFFSARLLASRVQAPMQLFSSSTAVRKIAARDLVSFLGFGIGILGLAKAGAEAHEKVTGQKPDFEIEYDPRSTGFGKIRIGPTRIDPWGGYQPLARYAAQIMTGQRKSGAGFISDASRKSSILRFFRSKLSPQAGLATDVALGETFLGEEVEPTVSGLKTQTFNRLVPLFVQDMVDAIRENEAMGAFLTLPGALGASVQSYRTFSQRVSATIAEDIETGGITDVDSKYGGEIPSSIGDLTTQDEQDFLQRHPDLVEEQTKLQERGLEQENPFAQMRQQGDDSRQRLHGDLDALRTRPPADQESIKPFWNEFSSFRTQRVGVLRQINDQFSEQIAELEKREPRNEEERLFRIYFQVQDRHPNRRIDADWDAYEADLAQSLTPEQLQQVRDALGVDDHQMEAQYHFLTAIPGEAGYYDLSSGSPQRRSLRVQNPQLDAALYLLGRVGKVLTAEARDLVQRGSQNLWGQPMQAEIGTGARRSGGVGTIGTVGVR